MPYRLSEAWRERLWAAFQFAVAAGIGCAVFLATKDDHNGNLMPPTVGSLICGFLGLWAVMFCVTWLRFGWKAARSMRM